MNEGARIKLRHCRYCGSSLPLNHGPSTGPQYHPECFVALRRSRNDGTCRWCGWETCEDWTTCRDRYISSRDAVRAYFGW